MTVDLPSHRRATHPRNALNGSLYAREFWAIQRHELVAGAADQLLTPAAAQAVQEILAPLGLVGLVDSAGWADTVKRRRPDPARDDPETLAFLQDNRNARNGQWHYVNLPTGAASYDREQHAAFTRPDDVVQITVESIRVLVGESSRFSKCNALRLVAHLVGDVHQPIHVGCGYLRVAGETASLVHDPAQVSQENLKSDEGGNRLFLPLESGSTKLHEYWDGALSQSDAHGHDADAAPGDAVVADPEDSPRQQAIAKIVAMAKASGGGDAGVLDAPMAAATPDLQGLPASWATESLLAARAAYQSLQIVGRRGERAFDVTWEGQAAYDARCKPIVEQRLADASRNLALLVNAIWP